MKGWTEDAADGDDAQTYAVIGAAMEVQKEIGKGFLEAVYQEALAIEFLARRIPFVREAEVPVRYKGQTLACTYRADFICYGEIIIELKAISELSVREHAQVMNYLKATGLTRALLFNFGTTRLEYKRLVLSSSYRRPSSPSAV